MSAERFTEAEWAKIRKELNRSPDSYGLPDREYGSVVIASFNIRKLGRLRTGRARSGRDEPTMHFLADVCRQFDLIAVQEVLPEMAAIKELRKLTGPDYGLLVSDVVGTYPGERGNEERLAFLYNRSLVRRGELVTDVGTSRTKVLRTLAEHHQEIFDLMEGNKTARSLRTFIADKLRPFRDALRRGESPKTPRAPSFKVDPNVFLQFIRTPFAASFEVLAHPGVTPYRFLAVNAHLHFGRPTDRRLEAGALVEWILGKVRSGEGANTVLLGDLNFDFDNPERDLERIVGRFKELGGFDKNKEEVFVSLPFIFGHPRPHQDHPPNEVFRSNIRLTQTYDQIGIFSRDARLRQRLETSPEGHSKKEAWGKPNAPDYGVFNFAELFCAALHGGKKLRQLSRAKRTEFFARFEHTVSDHMPIWIRLPLPTVAEESGFPTEV